MRSKWETEQDLALNGAGEQRGSDKGDRHRAKNVRQRVLDNGVINLWNVS